MELYILLGGGGDSVTDVCTRHNKNSLENSSNSDVDGSSERPLTSRVLLGGEKCKLLRIIFPERLRSK